MPLTDLSLWMAGEHGPATTATLRAVVKWVADALAATRREALYVR